MLLELWNAAKPIDFITLTQVLRDRNQLDQVGGAAFVTELIHIHSHGGQRGLLHRDSPGEIHPPARSSGPARNTPPAPTTSRTTCRTCWTTWSSRSSRSPRSASRTKPSSMKDQVMQAIEAIEELYDRRGGITGLPTGFAELDKMTDGLHGAEMIVIAARPSMGKTALAMNIAEHVAAGCTRSRSPSSRLEMSTSAARPAAPLLPRPGQSPARPQRLPLRARFPGPDRRRLEAGREQNLHRRHAGPQHPRAARQVPPAEDPARYPG